MVWEDGHFHYDSLFQHIITQCLYTTSPLSLSSASKTQRLDYTTLTYYKHLLATARQSPDSLQLCLSNTCSTILTHLTNPSITSFDPRYYTMEFNLGSMLKCIRQPVVVGLTAGTAGVLCNVPYSRALYEERKVLCSQLELAQNELNRLAPKTKEVVEIPKELEN